MSFVIFGIDLDIQSIAIIILFILVIFCIIYPRVRSYRQNKFSEEMRNLRKSRNGQISYYIWKYTNEERVKRGIPALKYDFKLSKASYEHSKCMINNHYFAHNCKRHGDLSSRLVTVGVYRNYVGENIIHFPYKTHGVRRVAKEAVNGWMDSPGHMENILNENFKRIGVGVYSSKHNMKITQDFSD